MTRTELADTIEQLGHALPAVVEALRSGELGPDQQQALTELADTMVRIVRAARQLVFSASDIRDTKSDGW